MLCPTCKKALPDLPPGAEPPPFFPFCSDRCKLIDLGRWLDEKYQIPVVEHEESPPRSPEADDDVFPPRFRRGSDRFRR